MAAAAVEELARIGTGSRALGQVHIANERLEMFVVAGYIVCIVVSPCSGEEAVSTWVEHEHGVLHRCWHLVGYSPLEVVHEIFPHFVDLNGYYQNYCFPLKHTCFVLNGAA